MIATADGIALAFATVLAAAVTVGLPLWYSSRRGRRKLLEQVGTPKENGSIAGDLHEFKGEMRYRVDRLDRGQEDLRTGQVEVTNAVAQVTAAVAGLAEKVEELNELHKPKD